MDGEAGGAVLGGRIACEPGQSVVLLQDKPAGEKTQIRGRGEQRWGDPPILVIWTAAGRRPPIPP